MKMQSVSFERKFNNMTYSRIKCNNDFRKMHVNKVGITFGLKYVYCVYKLSLCTIFCSMKVTIL